MAPLSTMNNNERGLENASPASIPPPSCSVLSDAPQSSPDLAPGNEAAWNDETFSAYVRPVREEMARRGNDFFYLTSIAGLSAHASDGEIWYGTSPDGPYYVKLIGGPGTLACNILCQKADLPRYKCNLEIVGDDIRETERKPFIPEDEDDPDLEDCSEEIAKLPLIAVDPEKHFTKSPTYKQEIRYLLQCKGSPRIVQLLGRSEEGMLVFPKFRRPFDDTIVFNKDQGRISNIKRWMLDVIDGVAYLHSLEIIHRDLTARNILESDPLVICDLQCLHGTYHPPELYSLDYTKFSPASDVFALGGLLWECCFYNNPLNHHVMLLTPPPPPFRDIFFACTKQRAEERPSLSELRLMYEKLAVVDH